MGNLKKKKNIYVIMTDEIGIHKLFFYKPQKSKKKKYLMRQGLVSRLKGG